MSRKSHLIGGLLCLAGGYLIGYSSGSQAILKGALGTLDSIVNGLPFLPGLVDQLSPADWYLSVGLVLILVGILMVIIGGSGGQKVPKGPEKKAQLVQALARPPGQSCKFCGADMKGSTTYCPSCGKSQT